VGVELVHGIFSIQLGAGAPALGEIDAALFSGMNRFLEIHVNGERLQPRQPMSSVPFAFQATQAVNASQLQGMTLADIVENLPEGPRGPQGERGLSGAAGADGTACTVTNNGGSATVSCTDGSSASVFDGADGAEGPPGPQGSQGPPGSDASVTPRCLGNPSEHPRDSRGVRRVQLEWRGPQRRRFPRSKSSWGRPSERLSSQH
jgi:hypothetical protein